MIRWAVLALTLAGVAAVLFLDVASWPGWAAGVVLATAVAAGAWASVRVARNLRAPLAARRWRLTPEGRIVVILSLGIAAAASNTGLNLLYILDGLLLALVLVSIFASRTPVRGLAVARRAQLRVEALRTFEVEVTVLNRKRFSSSHALIVEELGGEALDPELPARLAFPRVAAGALTPGR